MKPPVEPTAPPHLAKINLMSWTVAAFFGHVRDIQCSPPHLVGDRIREAMLFCNYMRGGVAPIVNGLEFEGRPAGSVLIGLEKQLRAFHVFHDPLPQPPDWLTAAEAKITLMAATLGMSDGRELSMNGEATALLTEYPDLNSGQGLPGRAYHDGKLEEALRLGEMFTNQKASMSHGEWLTWLGENVDLAESTVEKYMRVYERRVDLQAEGVTSLRGAYRMLKLFAH